MGRLMCCVAVLTSCAACNRGPQPTVITNPDDNGPHVVLWDPPSDLGSTGDGGGGGSM